MLVTFRRVSQIFIKVDHNESSAVYVQDTKPLAGVPKNTDKLGPLRG